MASKTSAQDTDWGERWHSDMLLAELFKCPHCNTFDVMNSRFCGAAHLVGYDTSTKDLPRNFAGAQRVFVYKCPECQGLFWTEANIALVHVAKHHCPAWPK